VSGKVFVSGKRSDPRTELRNGAGREQSGHDFGDNTFVIEKLKQARFRLSLPE
jgi:hypothetical protein